MIATVLGACNLNDSEVLEKCDPYRRISKCCTRSPDAIFGTRYSIKVYVATALGCNRPNLHFLLLVRLMWLKMCDVNCSKVTRVKILHHQDKLALCHKIDTEVNGISNVSLKGFHFKFRWNLEKKVLSCIEFCSTNTTRTGPEFYKTSIWLNNSLFLCLFHKFVQKLLISCNTGS